MVQIVHLIFGGVGGKFKPANLVWSIVATQTLT